MIIKFHEEALYALWNINGNTLYWFWVGGPLKTRSHCTYTTVIVRVTLKGKVIFKVTPEILGHWFLHSHQFPVCNSAISRTPVVRRHQHSSTCGTQQHGGKCTAQRLSWCSCPSWEWDSGPGTTCDGCGPCSCYVGWSWSHRSWHRSGSPCPQQAYPAYSRTSVSLEHLQIAYVVISTGHGTEVKKLQ